MARFKIWSSLVVVLALSVACSEQHVSVHEDGDSESEEEIDHGHWHSVSLDDIESVTGAFRGGTARFYPEEEHFQQVGLMIDGKLTSGLRYRVQTSDDTWSSPSEVEITWSEGNYHVARILLDEDASSVELIGGGGIERLFLEFYEEAVGNPELVTAERPLVSEQESESDDDLGVRRQAVAPASLVISRSDWGARNPNKACGFSHDPYRMSIHHTSIPADDGGNPAARMRQMQAFHIDNRGWCDIGYHFIVSQSGKIYQGRSSSQRTGAHVGGQNTGNIGISLIGNFEVQTPNSTQLDAAVDIMQWVHDTHAITLDSSRVKGHGDWPGQWTDCPGKNLKSLLPDLIQRVADGEGLQPDDDSGSDAGGSDDGGSDDGGSDDVDTDTYVDFIAPHDGAVVSNPVTFEIETSGVARVQIEGDGWPLTHDGWDPNLESQLTYEFVGTGFEREIVLYGYGTDGSKVAEETIFITVDDGTITDDGGGESDSEPELQPDVKFSSPGDGATVSNPVTFEFEATDVSAVQIEADEWPLAEDALDPEQENTLSFEFLGTGFEREIVLHGYGADGSKVAEDTIYITVTQEGAVEDDPVVSDDPGTPGGTFVNTYYYVADESNHSGAPNATLYAPDCSPIAEVSTSFADAACIEGSARLADGRVLNYYQPCSCGGPCSFCWSEMDQNQFPWGKGSQNNPLEPLLSVAVDTSVIDHGTMIYVEEWDGLQLPSAGGLGGEAHDGCFRADDVGGAINDNHIDIFAGNPAMWQALEGVFPTHSEFELYVDSPRCQ